MIEIRGLTFDHPGGVRALREVDLVLRAGEWLALMGPNGSGKTTLARCLNGLLLPTSGEVVVDGQPTSSPAALYAVRRRVAMVFQHPDDQLVAPTVESEIAFGLENHGVEPVRMRRRIDEVLEQFDLARYRLHPPHLLSGGERQRLAVASAVAVEPRYLVLDEPTALLDPHARVELLQWIGRLCHERGMSVIHITQSPEEASKAERLVVLHAGRVVADDNPRRVFTGSDELRRIGLGVPFAVDVAEAAGGDAGVAIDVAELSPWLTQHCAPPLADNGRDPEVTGTPPVPTLTARRLSHLYRSDVPRPVQALHEVDMDVGPAQLVGLVGPSGSGKTTLAQHFNGLLRPTSGQVSYEGADIWRDGDAKGVRRQVGLVFQFPEAQLFEETLIADVAFGPRNHGCTETEARAHAVAALDAVGLPATEFGTRAPLSLSGGERRRAAIAGVLSFSPAIVILDEPTAGLDPGNEALIVGLLRRLVETGHGLVLISHDMDRVAELTSHLTVLSGGRVHGQGATRSTLESSTGAGDGVLSPPTALHLTRDLRRHGWSVPTLMTRAEACAFAARLHPHTGPPGGRPDSGESQ